METNITKESFSVSGEVSAHERLSEEIYNFNYNFGCHYFIRKDALTGRKYLDGQSISDGNKDLRKAHLLNIYDDIFPLLNKEQEKDFENRIKNLTSDDDYFIKKSREILIDLLKIAHDNKLIISSSNKEQGFNNTISQDILYQKRLNDFRSIFNKASKNKKYILALFTSVEAIFINLSILMEDKQIDSINNQLSIKSYDFDSDILRKILRELMVFAYSKGFLFGGSDNE